MCLQLSKTKLTKIKQTKMKQSAQHVKGSTSVLYLTLRRRHPNRLFHLVLPTCLSLFQTIKVPFFMLVT